MFLILGLGAALPWGCTRRLVFVFAGFVVAGALSLPARAELPPIYQSIREIRTILESEEIGHALGIEPGITSIVKTKKGYRLGNGVCDVEVEVRYLPAWTEGPVEYRVRLGSPRCKRR